MSVNNNEIAYVKNVIKELSTENQQLILDKLETYINNSALQDHIAICLACSHFSGNPLGASSTHTLLEKFHRDNFENYVDNAFFTNSQNLYRFITRKSFTPGHKNNYADANKILVVSILFFIGLLSDRRIKLNVTKHPFYAAWIAESGIVEAIEAIINDPDNSNRYFANENVKLMGNIAEIASKALRIENTESEWINRTLLSNEHHERYYICYRLVGKQGDIDSPMLLKSFLILKKDISPTARIIHFYHRKAQDIIRRTNGGIIELSDTIYFLGFSSEVKDEKNLSEAKGMKLIAATKEAIHNNQTFFPSVVLSTNKNYDPLVASMALIETHVKNSQELELGKMPFANFLKDKEYFINKNIELEDVLNILTVDIDEREYAIRPLIKNRR